MAEAKLSLRKDRKNEAGECMVMARYRAKGEKTPLRLSTEIYVDPAIFQAGVIIGGDLHTRRLKQKQLDDFLIRITNIIDSFKKEGVLEPLGTQVKQRFDELYNKKQEPVKEALVVVVPEKVELSVLDAFQKFIDDSESGDRVTIKGKKIANGTIKNYKSTLEALKVFSTEKNYALSWSTIDYTFYKKFCNYCWQDKGYYDNNTGKYVKQIKTFLNYCVEEDIIPTPLYNKKWITWKEDDVDSFSFFPHEIFILDRLTTEELNGCKISGPRGESVDAVQIRNLLVLSCLTVLRVSDLLILTKYNFKELRGFYTLTVNQTKTNTKILGVPLPKMANKYIRWIISGGYQKITDQYYNRCLKTFGTWFMRYMKKHIGEYKKQGLVLQYETWADGKYKRDKYRQGALVKHEGDEPSTLEPLEKGFKSHMGRKSGITMYLIKGESTTEVMKRSGHGSIVQMLGYENMANEFVGLNLKEEITKTLDTDNEIL